jgi:uncharacterized protein (AIM24 family)
MDMDDFNFVEDNLEDYEFELKTDRILRVDVDGELIAKAGSMISSKGDLSYRGIMSPEGGVIGFIKDSLTSESNPVMKVSGGGTVHLSDMDKKIQVIDLQKGQGICVKGTDILAFQNTVDYKVKTVDSLSAVKINGLTNVYLEGPGTIAITTYGEPVTVEPPIKTDPKATVAWSGNLSPKLGINTNFGDIFGQSSRESYQLSFSDDVGRVIINPTSQYDD